MNNRIKWFQIHRLFVMAGAIAVAASLLGQGNSPQNKTKFGKGASHPLKGKLNAADPLAKDDTGVKNTPAVEEKRPVKTPGDGNSPVTTKEKEFNNDPAVKKEKDGPPGISRAPGKDGDRGNPGRGMDNDLRPEPPPPAGGGLFAMGSRGTTYSTWGDIVAAISGNTDLNSYDLVPLDETEAEPVVIGSDGRVRITPTTSYPWRTMVKLKFRFPNGANYVGSGIMIQRRYVLTAGHCVHSKADGGWATSMEVIPGFDNGYKPYGSAWGTYFRSYTGWTQSESRDHDWALITLDRNIGDSTGWLGYGTWSSLTGITVNLGGYPGDKGGQTLWYMAGPIQSQTTHQVRYTIDTYKGQSGSGVYRIINGSRYVAAIHTWGSSSIPSNGGTRLDSTKFSSLKAWLASGY